jgi:hypothetical protein
MRMGLGSGALDVLRGAVFLITGVGAALTGSESDSARTMAIALSFGLRLGAFSLAGMFSAALVVCDSGVPGVFLAMRSIPTAGSVMD